MDTQVTLRELLEAGVHFGHHTKRWNPKMTKFIFTEKNGIHIIDLSKTQEKLQEALLFLKGVVQGGGDVLFVGTKRQAQEVIEEIAKQTNVEYVTNRWIGGLLTNFAITRKNIKKMTQIEEGLEKGFENRTKQEISLMAKDLERLQRLYGGIRHLNGKPSVIVLADPHHERIAVREAKRLNIPIIAIVDTNCDPDEIDYLVPGNDDAIGSISLIFNQFAKAILAGREAKSASKEEVKKENLQDKNKNINQNTTDKSVVDQIKNTNKLEIEKPIQNSAEKIFQKGTEKKV